MSSSLTSSLTRPLVCVQRHPKLDGWPGDDAQVGAPDVVYGPLEEALLEEWSCDAHIVQYSVPDVPARLTHDAIAPLVDLGGVPIPLLIFEVDCPKPERDAYNCAPDAWWEVERLKVERLRADHPGVVCWRSRGGYRLCAWLPEPYVVTDVASRQEWRKRYLLLGASLHLHYEIKIDPNCGDWNRLQRLPYAVRKDGQREPGVFIGDPRAVGEWAFNGLAQLDGAVALADLATRSKPWAQALRFVQRGEEAPADAKRSSSGLVLAPKTAHLVAALGPAIATVKDGDGRHDMYLALSGTLLDRGVPDGELADLVEALARGAGDDRVEDRIAGAVTTIARRASGGDVSRVGALQGNWPAVAAAVDAALPPVGEDAVRKAFATLRAQKEAPAKEWPEVKLTLDEEVVVEEVVRAVVQREDVYHRAGHLVRVVGIDADAPKIEDLPRPMLRAIMTSECNITNYNAKEKDWVRARPPEWLIQEADTYGNYGAIGSRRLVGIVRVPVLLPSGAIAEPGYDPGTGLLYIPSVDIPEMLDRPTHADAIAAAAELLEVVEEFPFAGEEHMAAWLVALLTPLARWAHGGPAPAMLADANTRGSGKTRLMNVIGMLLGGRPMSTRTYVEDDEMRKVITTQVKSGATMMLLDNIAAPFGGATIDSFLTSDIWQDRLLGVNDNVDAEHKMTMYVTGNNVAIIGDTSRRVLHIRLESPDEHPERRKGFRHPDLLSYVKANRGRLLRAALTILRGYVEAGAPNMDVMQWGSFEGWSRLTVSAVRWLGLPDPGITQEVLQSENDIEAGIVALLIAGWDELCQALGKNACTTGEALVEMQRRPLAYVALRSAFSEVYTDKGRDHLPSPRSLGKLLRKHKARVVGGRALVSSEGKDSLFWRVRSTKT